MTATVSRQVTMEDLALLVRHFQLLNDIIFTSRFIICFQARPARQARVSALLLIPANRAFLAMVSNTLEPLRPELPACNLPLESI
jgi:hypothetical protein